MFPHRPARTEPPADACSPALSLARVGAAGYLPLAAAGSRGADGFDEVADRLLWQVLGDVSFADDANEAVS